MSFELLVCGASGTYPGRGRACSGYLLRTADTRVMLDCGNGSTSLMQRETAIDALDAVIITHRHHDHWADLVGIYYALRYHPEGQRSIDVYAPPGTQEFVAQLFSRDSAELFDEVCEFHDVEDGDTVTIGDLDLRFAASEHVVPTVSVRVEHAGAVLTYSSDSAGGQELVDIARGADVFLCEASWLGDPDDWPDGVHLTAREAGEHARRAGVGRLVLTHLWPQNDRDLAHREAAKAFDGPVDVADDGRVWQVGP